MSVDVTRKDEFARAIDSLRFRWNLNLVRRTDSDNLFAIEQDGCFWNRFTVAGVDYRPAAKDDCSAFDSR
jgi:hypothetical protein